MTTKFIKNNKAAAVMEYAMLIMIILLTFLSFQKYVLRAVSGKWKTVGDSFGFGRQYDPVQTAECAFDERFFNTWYDVRCFDLKRGNCGDNDTVCLQTAISACQGCPRVVP